MNNGRVNIQNSAASDYHFTDNHKQPIYNTTAINSITPTPLYNVFFTGQNIQFLQDKIIEDVKKICSCSISAQNETDLLIVMRSMYLQYAKNTPNIRQELQDINKYVLDYCVQNINVNIKHYLFYLNSISKLPTPLEHPKYMSPNGLRNYKDVIEE
jgi:hypothetical protein|tara:strand:- start:106 stop:573 length:468 start_codon:yes stop_codon:yes gene_type:complete